MADWQTRMRRGILFQVGRSLGQWPGATMPPRLWLQAFTVRTKIIMMIWALAKDSEPAEEGLGAWPGGKVMAGLSPTV